MIPDPIRAQEGIPVRVPAGIYEELAREGERVKAELGLNFGGVTRMAGALRFDNMIGTIATPGATLEISPKTKPGQDWLSSVLDLLDDRPVVVADDVLASDSDRQPTFADLIARIFARRLRTALSTEGAIMTIESEFTRTSMLSGRLRVGEWASRAAYDGHRFPVDRQLLSIQNAYSGTLSYVGQILGHHIADPFIRRQLAEAVVELSGGREVHDPPSNAVGLDLPDQWAAYAPAWTIAQMILRQRSRFGRRPQPFGMSLAIEPWILLENLLERTLRQLAKDLGASGQTFSSRPQRHTMFLSGKMGDASRRYLYPDCILLCDGIPIVNFEAKYRDYERSHAPLRTESYQAITAGRALGTSLAVLVYPNDCPTEIFSVLKSGHPPEELAVVGLDLFSYRRGIGERERADRLHSLLENVNGTYTMPDQGVSV